MDKKTQLSPYERWQLEKYGNLLPTIDNTPDDELFESGIEELNRLSEWIESLTAVELSKDYEYNHIG